MRAHWGAIAAADFFTAEVLTAFGLIRYHVFFVMDLKSRCVEIAGIASDPDGAWMMQVARNLTDAVDGFLLGKRHLILDRDPLYAAAFRGILMASDVKVVRLPARSPNLAASRESGPAEHVRSALWPSLLVRIGADLSSDQGQVSDPA